MPVSKMIIARRHNLSEANQMKQSQAIAQLKKYAAPIKAFGVTSLYIFGSTARDRAKQGSDLDLFVDYDPASKFNALDLVAAKRLLEHGMGIEVDLTTRGGLHPLLRKRIEMEAKRVF